MTLVIVRNHNPKHDPRLLFVDFRRVKVLARVRIRVTPENILDYNLPYVVQSRAVLLLSLSINVKV